MSSVENTDLLAELVNERLACLVQLRDLGACQGRLIAEGSMGDLLQLLAAKERLLAALTRIERRLDPFRRDAPEDRTWRNPEDRLRCAGAARRCELLLAEIVAQEKQSEEELRLRRDVVVAQLQSMHQAATAREAYHVDLSAGPRHLDLTSEG